MKTFKSCILLFLMWCALFATALTYGQSNFRLNKTESFNFAIVVDPSASINESGLNAGIEICYTGSVYTRLGVTSFAKLKDGYTDIIGGIGVVFTSGYFERTTYYSGIRLGVIIRQEANGSAGLEAGIDHKISNNLILGIRGTYDYRSDWEFYGADNGMQYSTFLKIGYCWFIIFLILML